MDIIAPIIHPNGDNPATLVAALEEQIEALHQALSLMCHSRPNARNYDAGQYEAADEQQAKRIESVLRVQQSLVAELEAIVKQFR